MNTATEKQQDYLAILFIDCGFTRQQRNIYLTDKMSREIKGLDELSISEASAVIHDLQELKEIKQDRTFQEDEDEPIR